VKEEQVSAENSQCSENAVTACTTTARSVEDLEVFKKAHSLTLKIYALSQNFPKDEKLALTSQMRRAAASIASNLLEGSHRLHTREYRHFVGISKGSAGELKYHALLAKDLGYISQSEYDTVRTGLEEVSRMLNGLVRSLSTQR
jgi:four helix bundle protein